MVKIGMLIADRYEVLEKIGTGGMSVVYKAKDHKLNRFVAVKILKQEFAENANFVSKFRMEAQAAAGLIHPNIVNVYDVGDEKGMSYIVMELVDGITLKKYIEKKSRLSVKEAISIAIQVSMGLEAAHAHHIIHRDIKPQNIMISKDGKVKVTDFGIAKAATSNTITSNVMGSVHYTSPEQARGGYSDERSDIYSLGITMFEMLTGRVPFNGETTVAIAIKHIQSPMPSPREFVPDIPRSVEQIVLKCCEKSPDRRYQNMSELIADLKQSLIHPDDDFVKVINPDEESATRMATPIEKQNLRHYRNTGAESDMQPAGNMRQSNRQQPQAYEEDSYPEDNDAYYQAGQAAGTNSRNGSRSSRVRRNPRYYDDYNDDYRETDSGYDASREHRITTISVIAAVIIGIVIIAIAAVKLGIFSGSGVSTNASETMVTMPTVIGQDVDVAIQNCKDAGLNATAQDESGNAVTKGSVIGASVEEGASVAQGSDVILYVGSGTSGITVPDVTGMTLTEAKVTLSQKGFTYTTKEASSDDVDENDIISQNPAGGSSAASGSSVELVVSTGKSNDNVATVPDLIGLSQDDAKKALEQANLKVGKVTEVSNDDPNLEGLVCGQSVDASQEVDKDTEIDLEISTGPKQTSYSYTGEITAPTDPGYVAGTSVYCVIIASDGTPLLNSTFTSFPQPIGFTNLTASSGTLQMSYTVTTTDANGNQTESTKQETRTLTFTPEN